MNITISATTTEIITALATLLTSILTGGYLYYTRKTFLEMKKQTDKQIRAYLFSSAIESKENCDIDYLMSFRKNYDEAILRLHPEPISNNTNFFIELSNRGKTDIVWWKITGKVDISVGEYLKNHHLENGTYTFKIEYSKSEEIIQSSNSILVSIGSLGYIPKASFKWTIEYKDLLGNEYKEFVGDSEYNIENPLIYKYIEPEKK